MLTGYLSWLIVSWVRTEGFLSCGAGQMVSGETSELRYVSSPARFVLEPAGQGEVERADMLVDLSRQLTALQGECRAAPCRI